MAKPGALATLDNSQILRRLESGEFLRHVAKELGVSHRSLSEHLGPQCRASLIIGQETKLQRLQERFDTLHIPPPPIKPLKRNFASPEDYADALDEYRSARESWKDNSTVPEFELDKLEKEFRTESWNAERSFPERWGAKAMVHLSGTITLDQLLGAVEQAYANPAIEGEVSAIEDQASQE